MQGKDPETCPFCNLDREQEQVIYRDEEVTALLSQSQVKEGHTLIIPNDHVTDLKDLEKETCLRMFDLLTKVANALEEGLDADGYNVAINQGTYAGQRVKHLHVHILPRKEGDLEEPWRWFNPEITEHRQDLEEIDVGKLVSRIKDNL